MFFYLFKPQKKPKEDVHMGCDLCKVEPSIVATFHFQHSNDEASNLVVFSGSLGMHTDTNDVILQTFFTVKSVSVLSILLSYLIIDLTNVELNVLFFILS